MTNASGEYEGSISTARLAERSQGDPEVTIAAGANLFEYKLHAGHYRRGVFRRVCNGEIKDPPESLSSQNRIGRREPPSLRRTPDEQAARQHGADHDRSQDEPADVGQAEQDRHDRADHEQQATDIAGHRYRGEIDFRAGAVRPPQERTRSDDGCSIAASTIAMIAPPATAASTNQPNIDQIAAKSVTREQGQQRVRPPPARASGWRLCQTRSAIASATPNPMTAIANQPNSGRMAAKSASGQNEQQVATVLPTHKGRDWTAHRARMER